MDPIIYKDILVLIAARLPVYGISALRSVCKLFRRVIDEKLTAVDTREFSITKWKFKARGVCINSVPYGLWVDIENVYTVYIDESETRAYAEREIYQHYPESKNYTKEIEKVAYLTQDGTRMVTKYIEMPYVHVTDTKEYLNDKPVVIYEMSEYDNFTTVYHFTSARSTERDLVCYKWCQELCLVVHRDKECILRVYITKYGLVYDASSREFNPFPGCKITDVSEFLRVNGKGDLQSFCEEIASILI